MDEKMLLEGLEFTATTLATEHASLLLIRGKRAHLGCRYFSVATADRLGDRFAVLSAGNIQGLLDNQVLEVSAAAREAGALPGMSGREALLAMERN